MKAFTKPLALVALLFLGAGAAYAQPDLYVEGTHYELIDEPVRTVDPNKIEVSEVFWYGCQHCYAFEPLINSWAEDLPDDVVFVRSPGMWNQMMEVHAQIYYAAQALDVVEQIHPLTFSEIHQRGNYLQTEDEVRALFTSQGISAEEFDKAWKSFSVTSAVKQAGTRMRDYGVRGVPNVIVNGKYRIGTVATQAEMLKIVDFLIEKERQG